MLTTVAIKNFQSLYDIKLQLSPFTVIVGPSSSGKSALTRALRTLTGNQRGTSFITHGERTAIITAETDRGTVSLSRGGTDSYTIIPTNEGEKQTFTKLGGAVPEEVTRFIGIAPKDPINYANQFDMPYLLTSSAAEVARTLGELTNVQVIFEAAREAKRKRLNASQTLKLRAADYEGIIARLDDFKNLKGQQAAIERAEEHVRSAARAEDRATALAIVMTYHQSAIEALDEIRDIPTPPDISSTAAKHNRAQQLARLIRAAKTAEHELSVIPEIKNLPSTETLASLIARTTRLASLITSIRAHATSARAAHRQVTEADEDIYTLSEHYKQTLEEAGTCPTCHQSTEGLAHASH